MRTATKLAWGAVATLGIFLSGEDFARSANSSPRQIGSSPAHQTRSLAQPRTQTIESRSLGAEIVTPEPAVRYRIEGGAFVSRTENGGATWFGGQVAWDAGLVAGSAPSAYVCWVVGNGGDIYVTTDGNEWRKIRPPAEIDFVGVSAKDAHSAVVIAADGRRFRTKNGGRSWHVVK